MTDELLSRALALDPPPGLPARARLAAANECRERAALLNGLADEVERLRADRDRLDWLDSEGARVGLWDFNGTSWEVKVGPTAFVRNGLRQAVDAARKAVDL